MISKLHDGGFQVVLGATFFFIAQTHRKIERNPSKTVLSGPKTKLHSFCILEKKLI